ncbi:unnamed protein product [Periconia digitata]|uniref:Isochorismatase-like domain-containing protein n=1 Tax=Periconia digitata TaxID=1303443 RepID=A0A9W4XJM8_9PLEO|nr:unnamed protein product [Periconia digitata]
MYAMTPPPNPSVLRSLACKSKNENHYYYPQHSTESAQLFRRHLHPRIDSTATTSTRTIARFGRGPIEFAISHYLLAVNMTQPEPRIQNPVLFICDLQEKFRPAIYEFDKVVATTRKMLKASQILNIPVVATTQNKARLGETCPELGLDQPGGVKTVVHADKTLFSMVTPEITSTLSTLHPSSSPLTCVLTGIESHICITQTALDLLALNHNVYILADAVSSCNKEEIPIALARLRAAGAVVTTSESWLYECVRDAGAREFRDVVGLVREWKEATRGSLGALL